MPSAESLREPPWQLGGDSGGNIFIWNAWPPHPVGLQFLHAKNGCEIILGIFLFYFVFFLFSGISNSHKDRKGLDSRS